MISYNKSNIYLSEKIPNEARDWRNQQQIFRWCRQTTLIQELDHLKWLGNHAWNDKNKMFGIYKKELVGGDDSPLGVCGFTNIDTVARHAEFSLYIAPEHQHQGYGLWGLYLLIRHGFEDFNFNKIWGETFMGNPAERLFSKLLFKKHPGHVQHYFKCGNYVDTSFFVLLQKEFLEGDYHGILFNRSDDK